MSEASFLSWSATDLLGLAARARHQARRFPNHPAGASLLVLADELSDRAEAAICRGREPSAVQQQLFQRPRNVGC